MKYGRYDAAFFAVMPSRMYVVKTAAAADFPVSAAFAAASIETDTVKRKEQAFKKRNASFLGETTS